MNWDTVATFDNAVAAEMAKNMLDSHGVTAMLTDGQTLTSALMLGGAIPGHFGNVKLLVPAESLERARILLEQKSAPPQTDESIAEAIAASPEIAEQFPGAPEPFDETPTDWEADKVLKATVFALLFPPLQLYTLARLWKLRWANPPVRPSDRWKIRLAYALSLPLWFAVVVPAVLLVGHYFDNSAGSGWRNERFGGFGDVALTVDLPGQYRYNFLEGQTILGPAKMRFFGTTEAGPTFAVSIYSLPKEWTPDDPRAALKRFVDDEFRDDYKVESIAPIKFDGYPGFEVVSASPRSRIRKQRYALIDHHIIALSADAAFSDRDGAAVKRFFRSAKLQ